MLSHKERRMIILKRVKHGWPVTTMCAHFGISRYTFYYHWNNYRLHGWEGLEVSPGGRTRYTQPRRTS